MHKLLQGWLLAAVAAMAPPLAADWAGFSNYAVLAELAVQPGALTLNLRIPRKMLPELAQRLGTERDDSLEALSRGLMRITADLGAPLQELQSRVAKDTEPDAGGTTEEFVEITRVLSPPGPVSGFTLSPAAGLEKRIGLVVLDRGVPLADLAPLAGNLHARLDTEDPWKSGFDDPGLVRRHAQPRSFLYVEPLEVRHELLQRLSDLKRWLPPDLMKPKTLSEDDQSRLAEAITKLIKGRLRLEVDGQERLAESEQVQFVGYTRTGVQPLPPGPVDTTAALVGIVLYYYTEQPAKSLSLTWDLFAPDAAPWPVSVLQGTDTFDAYVTPAHARLDWVREDDFEPLASQAAAPADSEPFTLAGSAQLAPESERRRTTLLAALLLPVGAWFIWLLNPRRRFAGLALAGALALGTAFSCHPSLDRRDGGVSVVLDEARLRALLPSMLHNAYRGFQLRDEEAVYDRLARSLDGQLLEETYLQQRRSLLRHSQGIGGLGKVDRVEVEHLQLMPTDTPATAEMEAEWVAHGSVSHWGHAHPRHNRYRARLKLQVAPDQRLRITAMDFLDGQTLGSGPAS
jgi:hypothetical protein